MFHYENMQESLQKKFFHLISYELAFRGGYEANYVTDLSQEKEFDYGASTNRTGYNPVFSKMLYYYISCLRYDIIDLET